MRARHTEYQSAREYLARIKKPKLMIPGNHDQPILPIADSIERFTHQFGRYQKYIHPNIDSALDAPGWFVIGLNDNHPIAPGGFWSSHQRAWMQNQLTNAPRGSIKVVVTHHQLSWGGKWRPAGFWYPTRALEFLARYGVDLVLNGHTHVPHAEQTTQGIVVARAGTATSGRLRHGRANSYNLISADSTQISIFVRQYDERADAFVSTRAFTFSRRTNLG